MKNETQPPTILLTRNEVAHQLRISERQLDRMRDQGLVPSPITVGSSPRWSRSSIIKWVEAHEQSDAPPCEPDHE